VYTRQISFGLVLGCIGASVQAKPECYFSLALGESRVYGVKTAAYEGRVFDSDGVTGGYRIDSKSRTTHFGGGCDLNRYLSIEADYREGFSVAVNSSGKYHVSVDGKSYDINFNSQTYRVSYDGISYTRSFDFRRFAKVRGYTVSGLLRYPLTEKLEPYARLGIMAGVEYVGLSSSVLPEGVVVAREKNGILPFVGLGVRYKLSKDWFVAAEKTGYADGRKLGEVSLRIGFRF
jgi:hypothetical protein